MTLCSSTWQSNSPSLSTAGGRTGVASTIIVLYHMSGRLSSCTCTTRPRFRSFGEHTIVSYHHNVTLEPSHNNQYHLYQTVIHSFISFCFSESDVDVTRFLTQTWLRHNLFLYLLVLSENEDFKLTFCFIIIIKWYYICLLKITYKLGKTNFTRLLALCALGSVLK